MHYLDSDFEFIYKKSEDIFSSLSNSKLFITGGTGFFGKWLLGAISYANKAHGCQIKVTALTRNPELARKNTADLFSTGITLLAGDIRTFSLRENDFDYLIHGATSSDAKIQNEQPEELRSVILDGTNNFLNFAAQNSSKNILFISSGAIYGPQDSGHFLQPEIQNPFFNEKSENYYALGKRRSEDLFLQFADSSSKNVSIARAFAFLGPYLPLDQHFAIGNFINNCLNQEDILIRGDGSPFRSYLYTADLVVWLLTILVKGENKISYNVGSDDGRSIQEIATVVKKIWMSREFESARTREPQVLVLQKADPSNPILRYVPSIQLSSERLNLKPWTSLDAGIFKTIKFHLQNKQR
jgi:nucleoside-diphosphate-sugar epimerase